MAEIASIPYKQYIQDWNSSTRRLQEYLLFAKTYVPAFEHCSLASWSEPRKSYQRVEIGRKKRATDRSLQLVRDTVDEHCSILNPLMKAIESGCRVADACIDLIIMIRGGRKDQLGWSEGEIGTGRALHTYRRRSHVGPSRTGA